jgi:hypothetical protein
VHVDARWIDVDEKAGRSAGLVGLLADYTPTREDGA